MPNEGVVLKTLYCNYEKDISVIAQGRLSLKYGNENEYIGIELLFSKKLINFLYGIQLERTYVPIISFRNINYYLLIMYI